MGNTIVKGDSVENPPAETGSTSTVAARKFSTVSAARILLCSEKVEYLTPEQKGHIRLCWKRIENDVARVGVITFIQ